MMGIRTSLCFCYAGTRFARVVCRLQNAKAKKKCPTCFQTVTSPVAQLPVNFALISSKGNTPPSKGNAGSKISATLEKCQTHGLDLDNFCVNCKILVCMKCAATFHPQHHTETEEDVFKKDGRSKEFVLDLQNKIETSVGSMKKTVIAADKLLNFINELEHCKEDIQKWKENLLSLRASATQDLEAWKNVETQSTEKKCEMFQALPRLWRDDAQAQSYNLLSENTKSKLGELQKVTKTLQEHLPDLAAPPVSLDETFGTAERSELLGDDVLWKVSSNNDVRRALASARLERRPSRLQVISSATDPIQRLPEVLDILGAASLGDIKIRDMSSFWGASPGNLLAFIGKHGHKVTEFFGTFDEATALTCARGESKVTLGIGISATDDIHLFPQSNAVLQNISFNGSLSSIIENCRKPQKWTPTALHFPNLRSGDQVYVAKLLEEYFGMKKNLLFHYVYFPRCHLTEDDMNELLKHCKQSLTICCENESLTVSARSRLDNSARQIYVTIHWNLSPTE